MLSRKFGSSKNVSADNKQNSPLGSTSKLPNLSGSKRNLGPKLESFDGLFDKEISVSTDNVSKVGKKYETKNDNKNPSAMKSFHSSLNISNTSGEISSLGEWFNAELEGSSNHLRAPNQPLLKRPKSVENLLRS